MKKLLTVIFSLVLVMALTVTAFAGSGLDNFQKKNTYKPGQFKDVPANSTEWYVTSVKAAYEYGLSVGNADGTFGVNDNLTIAQTLAFAARLNNIYNGGTGVFDQTGVWYQVYVDYCIAKGIIKSGEYPNYDKAATRAQFVSILAKAFPDSALQAINTVEYIPDVTSAASYYDAAIKLYRAGILTGSTGNKLLPNDNIKRSEVAAIVTRMADTSLRQSVTLKKETVDPTPVDPTPVDPTPSDNVKVNTKAYDAIINYVNNYKIDNQTSYVKDGITYIMLGASEGEGDDDYATLYMLLYNKSESKLSIVGMHTDTTNTNPDMMSAIFFDKNLTTPYSAMFACASGEETNFFSATTTINPTSFKAAMETLSWSDVEGLYASDKSYQKSFSSVLSVDIACGLYAIEQTILKDKGYSLSDLGFGDLGLDAYM